MGNTIRPAFITLRRAHQMSREILSGSRKTVYLKGLHELARHYGSFRNGVEKMSFEKFPAIKKALGNLEVGFTVNNYSAIPDTSSIIRAGLKACLRDLASFGLPKEEKKGTMVDFRFDKKTLLCEFRVIPEGPQKANIIFEIFSLKS